MTIEQLTSRILHLGVDDYMLLCNLLDLNCEQLNELLRLCRSVSSSQNSNCVK